MTTQTIFAGDFDLLPIAATLHFSAVPMYPTADDFHAAVSEYEGALSEVTIDGVITMRLASARWRVEAIRWRRGAGYGVTPMDLATIASRTAAALHAYATAA